MVIMSIKPSTNLRKIIAPKYEIQALGWGQYYHILKIYKTLDNILLYSHTYMKTTKRMVKMEFMVLANIATL